MLRTSIFSTLVVLLAFLVAPAQAQDASQSAPAPEQAEVADEAQVQIPDEELQSIAAAYVAVENLKAVYEESLTDAADDQAAEAVKQELAAAKSETIANSGVSVERYEEVLTLAETDQELNNRLQAQIATVKQAQGAGS